MNRIFITISGIKLRVLIVLISSDNCRTTAFSLFRVIPRLSRNLSSFSMHTLFPSMVNVYRIAPKPNIKKINEIIKYIPKTSELEYTKHCALACHKIQALLRDKHEFLFLCTLIHTYIDKLYSRS